MDERVLLSMENSKLWVDGIACFGLPAPETCIGSSSACRKYCYTNFHHYCFPSVKNSRRRNYRISKSDVFVEQIQGAIEYLPRFFKYVRIHDSGDFYSQEYLDKWKRIAKLVKDMQFYAYTKSLNLNLEVDTDNFHIIQSEGGKYDHLIDETKSVAKVFASKLEIENANFIDCSESDLKAAMGCSKIGLTARGTGRYIWRKIKDDSNSNETKKIS